MEIFHGSSGMNLPHEIHLHLVEAAQPARIRTEMSWERWEDTPKLHINASSRRSRVFAVHPHLGCGILLGMHEQLAEEWSSTWLGR